MLKLVRYSLLFTLLGVLSLCVAACGPAKTITDTITEADFQQVQFICQDHGLYADFQPGKIVCSGEFEGKPVVIQLIPKISDGKGYFQVQLFTSGGEVLAPEDYAELNDELSQDTFSSQDGYAITSIVITHDDITITSSLK
jgi:hypothetical protein